MYSKTPSNCSCTIWAAEILEWYENYWVTQLEDCGLEPTADDWTRYAEFKAAKARQEPISKPGLHVQTESGPQRCSTADVEAPARVLAPASRGDGYARLDESYDA